MVIQTKIIKYDDGWKSQSWYYLKRGSKTLVSLIVAGVITYMLSDNRFIMLVPFLEVAQKLAKENGIWY